MSDSLWDAHGREHAVPIETLSGSDMELTQALPAGFLQAVLTAVWNSVGVCLQLALPVSPGSR